jgi:hypothetical protein
MSTCRLLHVDIFGYRLDGSLPSVAMLMQSNWRWANSRISMFAAPAGQLNKPSGELGWCCLVLSFGDRWPATPLISAAP